MAVIHNYHIAAVPTLDNNTAVVSCTMHTN